MPSDAGVSEGLNWISLSVVVAVHALLLAAIVISGAGEIPPHIAPPAVIGVLVSEPAPPAPKAPKPLPVEQSKPKVEPRTAKSRPAPTSKPAPAVPSERAISAPPPSTSKTEETAVAPPAQPTPAAPTAAPASEAITPPRTDAKALNNPAPIYPPVSRRLGEHGRVELDIYILADGSVGEIKLKRSSGYDRLDQSAMDAVRRWHYIPARKGNQPIPYWYVQPVSFGFKD